MTRLYVVVEGQTEEAFVNDVLGPTLCAHGVYPFACILGRPGHKGGNVNYERVKNDVLKFLKQEKHTYCTTMFDFYGLGGGFPGMPLPPTLTHTEKANRIEQAMRADVVRLIPDQYRPALRFLPYIQLHEFEGLLFSDSEAFARGINQPDLADKFQKIRNDFQTPEDINDDPKTAPSQRVLAIYRRYNKPINGLLAAKAVGIDKMRRECPHFNEWVGQLEKLASES